jgi:hypothetical protein
LPQLSLLQMLLLLLCTSASLTWYPSAVHPASCRKRGIWVVLPHPVSPTTTTVAWLSTRYSSSRFTDSTGKPCFGRLAAGSAAAAAEPAAPYCCCCWPLNLTPKAAFERLPGL